MPLQSLLILLVLFNVAPARPCSKRPWIPFNQPRLAFFTGAALQDTILAGPGPVRYGTGGGHFGQGRERPIYGQVVAVDRIGQPWTRLLPAKYHTVIMVPWDYDPACSPVIWGRSFAWMETESTALFQGTLRDRSMWVEDTPTFDVHIPQYVPYPGEWAAASARTDSILTPPQLLKLYELLPLEIEIDSTPVAAAGRAVGWAAANPDLAQKWPADELLNMLRWSVELAQLRMLKSPIAGTYSVDVILGTGEVSSFLMRTESGPMSAIRARTRYDREPTNPIIGYYLMAHWPKGGGTFPSERVGSLYVAVSLDSTSYGPDSTVWRGSIDSALETAALEAPNAEESAKYEDLFAVAEELTDPDYYYMPGHWVRGPDGVVRYSFVIERDGELIFKVIAERISEATVSGRLR